MFHTYRKVLVIAGIVFCLFSSVFAYSGGSGEPNNPYQIATVSDWQQLKNTSSHWNKCFVMTADVNLQGFALTPVGNSSTEFTGVFDGNNHIIRNANINMPYSSSVGLFGYVSGQIRNLGVEDVDIIAGDYVGGLAGMNYGNIINCYITGIITGNIYNENLGGLTGMNNGTISNCYVTGSVTGSYSRRVGGLVGLNYGRITDCYTTGTAAGGNSSIGGLVGWNSGDVNDCYSTDAANGCVQVGGLIGYNYNGAITGCYAAGTTFSSGSLDMESYSNAGGLIGQNSGGNITNCYATGAVNGSEYYVGGLVGISDGNITNCYATDVVIGSGYTGGLVGQNNGGNITTSFWDVNTSGQTYSDGGEGKTTAEMQTLSTFTSAGWDFSYNDGDDAEWFIQIDEYPILTWQISPADIYTDGRNNFRDFAIFAEYWMRNDCRIYNDYCNWADLNFDGSVNYDDLIELMSYWLEEGIYE